MKILNVKQSVEVPEGVEASVKARTVTIKGARGTLVRSFRHLAVDIFMSSPNTITVEKHFGKRKELAAVRTVCSIITRCELSMLTFPSIVLSLRVVPLLRLEISLEKNSSVELECTRVLLAKIQRNKRTS